MNLTQVGRADRSDKGTSGSRKSHRITLAELNVDIPMNPLSARISRTRLSSDWAETFIHGIETSSTRGESEPTIKECSSSTASITRSHSSDLKAFANDVKTFKVKNWRKLNFSSSQESEKQWDIILWSNEPWNKKVENLMGNSLIWLVLLWLEEKSRSIYFWNPGIVSLSAMFQQAILVPYKIIVW